MKTIFQALTVSTLALTLSSGSLAFAQDHHGDQDHHDARDSHHHAQHYDNHHYVHHSNWRRGYRMSPDNWRRGDRIDWRAHHLRQPPRGYEWREVDGNYVMAAIATGVIASVIIASAQH